MESSKIQTRIQGIDYRSDWQNNESSDDRFKKIMRKKRRYLEKNDDDNRGCTFPCGDITRQSNKRTIRALNEPKGESGDLANVMRMAKVIADFAKSNMKMSRGISIMLSLPDYGSVQIIADGFDRKRRIIIVFKNKSLGWRSERIREMESLLRRAAGCSVFCIMSPGGMHSAGATSSFPMLDHEMFERTALVLGMGMENQ